MSTQDPEAGTPISILPETDLQHCRLLELPAELLNLVTSANPPVLYLKSKENIDGSVKDANTVLCTSDKTYEIRQVSTSNTVYLTRSAEHPDERGGPPKTSVDAVSKCDSTLELIAASKQSAASFIKAAVPVFTSTGISSQKILSKEELFSHIPLSQAECEESWTELACFESVVPPFCAIPSAKVKVDVWQKILTAATADGTSLTDPFIANDVPAFAMDVTGDFPEELVLAILAAMSTASPGGNLMVDEDKCVRFVGFSQLEARSAGRPTEIAKFLAAWKDSVPEAWRDKCELAALQGFHSLQEGNKYITYVDTSATGPNPLAATEAKSTFGAKRKWHEKFRPSKKS